MSFFSRSSKGSPYRNGHQGSTHYRRKGFFGHLMTLLGSNSSRDRDYYEHPEHYQNRPDRNMANRMITCMKCNAQLPFGSKFCSECGEKVLEVLYCISCGEKLSSDIKFCPKCGTETNG